MKTILLLALIGCTVVSAQNAVAVLKSSIINGVVRFSPTDDNRVLVSINITNLLPSGRHGFHIHQFGDLTDGCVSAGPHFNPLGLTHGAPYDLVRHVGDLGNIVADSFGTVNTQIIDNQIALSGPNSIIGRAVVVHALTDDLGRGTGTQEAESKKTGNAGARVACAVIGLAKN